MIISASLRECCFLFLSSQPHGPLCTQLSLLRKGRRKCCSRNLAASNYYLHLSLPLPPSRKVARRAVRLLLPEPRGVAGPRGPLSHRVGHRRPPQRARHFSQAQKSRHACREREVASFIRRRMNLCNFLSRNCSNEGGRSEGGRRRRTGGPSDAASGIVISAGGRTESTVFQLKNLTNSLPAPITNKNSYCLFGSSTQTFLLAA